MTRNQFLKLLIASIGVLSGYPILPQSKKKEVLIIGAGISGLAAGRRLIAEGFQVTILEARNRIGGRIWTDNAMGNPIEMGATFVYDNKLNPISKLINQFKMDVIDFPLEKLELYDSKGNNIVTEDNSKSESHYKTFQRKLNSMKDSLSKGKSILSAKDIILPELVLSEKERDSLDILISSNLENKFGTDLKNISLQSSDEKLISLGSSSLIMEGFSELIHQLGKGLNVKFSHIVSKIEYDKTIKVTTNQGEFTSDYAIVTVPLGVLKKKKIQFVPELPEKKQFAIQNLGFGTINKVFYKFPKKFWSNDFKRFKMISQSKENFVEFWDLNVEKQTPILTTFLSGDSAISLETKNKKDILRESMVTIKKIFGNKAPTPVEIQYSKWNLDPFSAGTSSYLSIHAELENFKTLGEPVGELLRFAGEATVTPSNSVEAAFLSGEREANRIIQLNRD